jgi:predicted Holliday junction resolvase-like endonuclease
MTCIFHDFRRWELYDVVLYQLGTSVYSIVCQTAVDHDDVSHLCVPVNFSVLKGCDEGESQEVPQNAGEIGWSF